MKNAFSFLFFFTVIVFFYNPAATARVSPSDTLPAKSLYEGYRINITHIEVLKKSTRSLKIRCDIVNTGREYIALGPKNNTRNLEINFDESLSAQGLSGIETNIRKQVMSLPVAIQVGQIIEDRVLEITLFSKTDIPAGPLPGNTVKKEPPKAQFFSDTIYRNYCPDLIIDTIRVVSMKKKWATLEFRIRNIGKSPARLTGADKNNQDDIAVKAYLSGTKNLTKGALPIGGVFAGKNLKGKESNLLPGDTYTDIVKLDISKKTKYTSIIILFVDNYLLVSECDETNNAKSIQLR